MFVMVKSLVPGQIIHAAIDIVNGTLAGRVVKRLGPEESDAEGAVHATDLEGVGTDVSVTSE